MTIAGRAMKATGIPETRWTQLLEVIAKSIASSGNRLYGRRK